MTKTLVLLGALALLVSCGDDKKTGDNPVVNADAPWYVIYKKCGEHEMGTGAPETFQLDGTKLFHVRRSNEDGKSCKTYFQFDRTEIVVSQTKQAYRETSRLKANGVRKECESLPPPKPGDPVMSQAPQQPSDIPFGVAILELTMQATPKAMALLIKGDGVCQGYGDLWLHLQQLGR